MNITIIPHQGTVRADVVESLSRFLDGHTRRNPVHWSDITSHFVDGEKGLHMCSIDELIAAMNSLVMPFGDISGANNKFWRGLPES